jgi:hypothetical protein
VPLRIEAAKAWSNSWHCKHEPEFRAEDGEPLSKEEIEELEQKAADYMAHHNKLAKQIVSILKSKRKERI